MNSARTVSDIGNQIKAHFEKKEWPALGELLQLQSLWFVYQPLSVPEALAMAQEVLGGAEEVEVTLLRIVRTESTDAQSRGSYQCRLGWFEPAKLKQQEVSFDLHLGFQLKPEVKLEYLGITEASPEPSLPVEEPAPASKEAAPVVPAAAAAPAGSAPVPVMPGLPPGAVPLAIPAMPAAEGGGEASVMVYVPMLVPASAVQANLRRWLGS